MSDYVDTREGWTEVQSSDNHQPRLVAYDEHNRVTHIWVPEAPVPPLPPLPTAQYTVIRVTEWSGGGRAVADLMLRLDGTWYDDTIGRTLTNPETITSFEVLSEPRAVTAKAVIDRVSEMWTGDERIWDVAREFGVES